MPKFNMYQSLHTTVIGPGGKPVELQIRTHSTCTAAPSTASPRTGSTRSDGGAPRRLRHADRGRRPRRRRWPGCGSCWTGRSETAGPERVPRRRCASTCPPHEVYVFTPKGDVIALPAGSTPVDFAYAVHTEVGHRCIGARVNGRLVPLESHAGQRRRGRGLHLQGGERRARRRDWLGFVKSPRARNKIRALVLQGAPRGGDRAGQGRHREGHAQAGPAAAAAAHRRLAGHRSRTRCTTPDISALYAAIGEGHVSAQSVVQKLVQALGGEEGANEDIAETDDPDSDRRRPARRRAGGRPGCRGQGRRRRLGQAVALLHAGAGRPDRRLRHPRQRRLGAPRGLRQRGRRWPSSRSAWSRSNGRPTAVLGLPGRHPGRGARPVPAAVRRHPGAVRPARQHPVGGGAAPPATGSR